MSFKTRSPRAMANPSSVGLPFSLCCVLVVSVVSLLNSTQAMLRIPRSYDMALGAALHPSHHQGLFSDSLGVYSDDDEYESFNGRLGGFSSDAVAPAKVKMPSPNALDKPSRDAVSKTSKKASKPRSFLSVVPGGFGPPVVVQASSRSADVNEAAGAGVFITAVDNEGNAVATITEPAAAASKPSANPDENSRSEISDVDEGEILSDLNDADDSEDDVVGTPLSQTPHDSILSPLASPVSYPSFRRQQMKQEQEKASKGNRKRMIPA